MSAPSVTGKIREPVVIGGNVREHYKTLNGPSAYETGGSTLTANDLGAGPSGFIVSVIFQSEDATQIAHPVYPSQDPCTTVKMLMTDLAGTQVANGVDKSAKKFRAIVKTIS